MVGSGPHSDLNSHLADLACVLVAGSAEVMAITTQFTKDRPLPVEASRAVSRQDN